MAKSNFEIGPIFGGSTAKTIRQSAWNVILVSDEKRKKLAKFLFNHG